MLYIYIHTESKQPMKGTLPGTKKSSKLVHSLGKKSLWEVSIGAKLVFIYSSLQGNT